MEFKSQQRPIRNRRLRWYRRAAAKIEYCLVLSLAAIGGIAGAQKVGSWSSKALDSAQFGSGASGDSGGSGGKGGGQSSGKSGGKSSGGKAAGGKSSGKGSKSK